MQTTISKPATVKKKWYVVDASGMVLGRLATQVATILRGKHKPSYTPHVDDGDYVIVINASKIKLTGKKWTDKKYYHHSHYPGGLKVKTAKTVFQTRPEYIVEHAIKGMLPHNTLGRNQGRHLFVYAHDQHHHEAQQPMPLKLEGANR